LIDRSVAAGPVVSADWLSQHLDDEDVVVVDATVHLPDTGRDAAEEYRAGHIPGALFFDLSRIADPDNPLPRKVPGADLFAREVGLLGIGNTTHVIAYDTPGLYSAARVWWLFKMFGHDRISILDGGLVAWKAAGGGLENGAASRAPTTFHATPLRDMLARWPDVLEQSKGGGQILDARTPGRFSAVEQDRYPGTRAGHIPGSRNLYWGDLLEKQSRRLLPKDEIERLIRAAGIDPDQPVTLTCGSGLTACILALGLHVIGRDRWRVYDGSWDEWGRRHDLPVEPTLT